MKKTRETRTCVRCGAAFEVTQATLRKSPRNGRFCSIVCHNKSLAGRTAWNKGLTMSEAFRKACAEAKRPPAPSPSAETRAKHRARLLGTKRDAAFRAAARRATIKRHEAGVYARTADTRAERALAAILDRVGVAYERQAGVLWWVADFLIRPLRLVLEADGDYWHCNPAKFPDGPINALQREALRRDRRRDIVMGKYRWSVIRFWEADLLEQPEVCAARLRTALLEAQHRATPLPTPRPKRQA